MKRKLSRHGVLVEGTDDLRPSCRTGKITHQSRAMARRHKKGLIGSTGKKNHEYELHVYRCCHCDLWHVGHDKRRS